MIPRRCSDRRAIPGARALAAGVGLMLLLGAVTAFAAIYQGHTVDRHRYHGSIVNFDYGAYDNVEIQFHGDRAFVYFPAGGRIVLVLQEEEIEDPHHILADDPRRGIVWEIDVKDLVAR